MSDDDVIKLSEHRKPEQSADQRAAHYKAAATEVLGQLMELMRESEREDFTINFQIQRDPIGVPFYANLHVIKRFP